MEKEITTNQKERLLREILKYKTAFELVMEYFDSISDEEKPILDKKLKKLNL